MLSVRLDVVVKDWYDLGVCDRLVNGQRSLEVNEGYNVGRVCCRVHRVQLPLVPGSVRTCADMVNMLVLYANRLRLMQQCDFAGLNVYRIMFLGVRGNCVCVCVLCACLVVVVVGWSGVDVVPVCDALEDE